jgi:hypothetical protein
MSAVGVPEGIINEPSHLTPDKFLSLQATEIMQQIPGQPLTTDLLPKLLSELSGFSDTPDMITGVANHADHWFALELDAENTHCEGISYDSIGLIGLKFDNPAFSALVIQPDDDNDGACRINVVNNGVRHEYKMVGGELMLGLRTQLPEESRTFQMLSHLGVDTARMDQK